MSTKNAPGGEFDCYRDAKPDEPMFVLLARDWKSPGLVRQWAKVYCESHYGPSGWRDAAHERKYNEALECAASMERWRDANPRTA